MVTAQGFLGGGWKPLVLLLGAASSAALGGGAMRPAHVGAGLESLATRASQAAATPARTISSALASGNCAWVDVPSPNTGSPNNTFNGVAAIAADDVWAVGGYGVLGISSSQLLAHWDGVAWSFVKSPVTAPSELTAISAVETNDVWAVGGYDTGGQALIQHWDGARWSVVAHPNPGLFNRFFGVAAVSKSEVWAVGVVADGGLQRTLVERWDGSSWKVVPSPNVPNQHNQLNSITAVPGSPNELWAVGQAGPTSLILHWNGAQWSLVPSPSAGTVPILTGVAAVSSNDVWAVGWTSAGSGPITLTEHWDGSAWSVVPSPNPSSTSQHLHGVTALAANDVWAVGDFNAAGGNQRTLILRWNGTAWVQLPGDDTGPKSLPFTLNAVSALSGNDVWSVGTNSHSLAEHWNGAQWKIVASPNAGVGDNVLGGVSGSSSTDVWQVGHFKHGVERRTLIQHWDGSTWKIARSPNTNKSSNVLEGVVAISPSDAWAVGHAYSSNALDQTTLILRWDGADWRIAPSPSPGTFGLNELHGVDGSSANGVWAVGNFTHVGGYSQTLTLRWNSSSWIQVPSANVPGVNNGLFGVAVVAADDVWAVGYHGVVDFSVLVTHWDGSAWSVVPSPDPFSSNILRAVSASGAADVWTVGTTKNPFTSMTGGLIERWDGNAWSLVNGAGGALYGVAAVSPGDAWQVGDSAGLAWIGRWNGSTWEVSPSPSLAGRLHAAAAITAGDVWAVGQRHVSGGGLRTLSEHFVCSVELYCFCGAGGGCSNPDPGAGCANSTGSGASLFHSSGSTSVALDDLVLGAAELPPNQLGIFLMGGAQASLPFSDGRLCVGAGGAGVFRYPRQSSGASGTMALGPGIVAHSQTFPLAGGIQAGSTWYFQAWYRDAAGPCGTGANLTNAAKVTFQP